MNVLDKMARVEILMEHIKSLVEMAKRAEDEVETLLGEIKKESEVL